MNITLGLMWMDVHVGEKTNAVSLCSQLSSTSSRSSC